LCALVLLHSGVRTFVAGTSMDAGRLALAKQLGAARVIDVERENLVEIVRAETAGVGVDVAFEVAGAAASASACLAALRPLGRYTQVGHFGREITVPFDHVAFKQLLVAGSVGYTVATWRRTLELLAQGLQPSRIVTHRLPLEQWREGFDLFERKAALKVLLRPVS
jgi:L-iditol 2-dehydrogenase